MVANLDHDSYFEWLLIGANGIHLSRLSSLAQVTSKVEFVLLSPFPYSL